MKPDRPELPLTDEELASWAGRRGDAETQAAHAAFDELHRRHARPLLAFLAGRVVRSDLADVQQTVWLSVWQHVQAHFHGGSFRAWLFRIARNCLIDRVRRRRPESIERPDERPDRREQRPDELLAENERRDRLRHCLDQLPAPQAALVRGRLGGEDYDALASRLALPVERLHRLFHAAKAALQECLARTEK